MNGKKHLTTLFLLALAVGLAPVHATDYLLSGITIPGSIHCENLGGVYQSPRTCVIGTGTIVLLQSDDKLTISSSWILRTYLGGHLYNAGEIDNRGLIENFGSIHSSGTIISDGTIANHHVINNEPDASLTNNSGGQIDNYGTLDNEATLRNNSDATIINRSGAEIHNQELIVNNGTITNHGVLYLYCLAYITGSGSFTGNPPIEDAGPDSDGDEVCDPYDCAPSDGTAWSIPHSSLSALAHTGGVDGTTTIMWTIEEYGGTSSIWEALIILDPGSLEYVLCLQAESGEMHATYTLSPNPGKFHAIGVRGRNSCGTYYLPTVNCP